MTTRKDLQRGAFITAPGGPAEIHDKRDGIVKGMRMTSTPNVRPIPLEQKYPEMAGMLEAAGPLGGSAFEKENAAILEVAARLRAIRWSLQAPRKRK